MDGQYEIKNLDADDYSRGFLQLLEQLTIVDSDKISKQRFAEKLDKILGMGCHTILVIVNNQTNTVIATGTLVIEEKFIHNLGRVGHIEDIVVDKDFRGSGLGKVIVNALVSHAKKSDCYKVILDCAESNVGFYEKCGFIRKGIELAKYF